MPRTRARRLVAALLAALLALLVVSSSNGGKHLRSKPCRGAACVPPPPPPPTPPTSTTRIAVVLINFQNDQAQPWTPAYASQIAFDKTADSAAAFYDEASHGQRELVGDVYGWWTIPFDSSASCDTLAWKRWVQDYAQQTLGLSLVEGEGYDHIALAWPRTNACGFGGRAGSFYNGALRPQTLAHELGHFYRLNHANRYACVDSLGQPVPLSLNCTSQEYGDIWDIMGGSFHHPNGWEQAQMGWITPTVIAASGRYTLAPLNQGRRVLYVNRPDGTQLVVEIRANYGHYDVFATDTDGVGVMIRLANGANGGQTHFIDATPDTETTLDGLWKPGQTLTDPLGGSITVVSASPAGAVLDISVG